MTEKARTPHPPFSPLEWREGEEERGGRRSNDKYVCLFSDMSVVANSKNNDNGI
jgi:hypothetical protein